MKYILIMPLFGLLAYAQPASLSKQAKQTSYAIDTSKYAILKFDNSNIFNFDKNVKAATISANEVIEIDRLLDSTINAYNKVVQKIYEKNLRERADIPISDIYDARIQHISKYKKQLIAVINTKGEKLIWVNCFNSAFDAKYWKKRPVMVMDGGNWFLNLKINLTQKKVYDFVVNGVA
jgi:hypothetical protein